MNQETLDKIVLWLKEPSTFRGLVVGLNIILNLSIPAYKIDAMLLVIAGLISLHETFRKELR